MQRALRIQSVEVRCGASKATVFGNPHYSANLFARERPLTCTVLEVADRFLEYGGPLVLRGA